MTTDRGCAECGKAGGWALYCVECAERLVRPCLNCDSLQSQNTELDAKLAQLEQQLQAAYQRGRDDEAADQFRRTDK